MTVFIARVVAMHPLSYKRTFEEQAFSTYEKAYSWLQEAFFTDNYYSGYCAEIVEFNTDQQDDTLVQTICFDHAGQRISYEEDTLTVDPLFTPKYALGDLVQFKELSQISLKFTDRIGVIAGLPRSAQAWTKEFGKERERDYTDEMYTVEHICELGFSDHSHLMENDFQSYRGKLPDKLKFLDRFSRHLSGKELIADHLLEQIYSRKVFLLNVPSFRDLGL